ncbi:GDP-L-fucose synthase [Sphingobacterium sp. N143]|uniref:GDP-L-fucose synthase n=1 Tax=Sphingobacterium sp. N143 TaxID=2746727 RepID=UPI002576CB81|nr:GDP-L-fucose synthase [Sphingobacterium sp. N143]MDM1292849.1 GDP-L-fucose synthase [Sphingobacterium sp. N143]
MRILILGCGWLAESFAVAMTGQGHEVWASTTQYEKYHRLKADGIFSFIIDFDRENFPNMKIPDQFDFILNSISATQKNSVSVLENRFSNISLFLERLKWTKQLFLGSIGIYPDKDAVFDELFAERAEFSEKLLLAEQAMLAFSNTHVYRLGGLFGKDRVFAKYFANRICATGEQTANFVHLDDVVKLIGLAAENNLAHLIYNVVAPVHPKKMEVVVASARKYGFALPTKFETGPAFQKVVSGNLLQKELGYRYLFPDPREF